jgi:hypothetical protein
VGFVDERGSTVFACVMRVPVACVPPTRFADPAHVYHRRGRTDPPPPSPLARSYVEPSVYHPVAIHRDLGHVHLMVTRRSTNILCRVDRFVLTTVSASAASSIPSPVRATLVDPHCRRAMEKYSALLANHTWDLGVGPSILGALGEN